jgi:hypothetical protein
MGRANTRLIVIASEAIHSYFLRGEMDCFAPLAMTVGWDSRGADRPRFVSIIGPPQ